MKQLITFLAATVFAAFSFAQQPILWGMASAGGAGNGTVFKIEGNGSNFNTSYSFPEANAGAIPQYTQLCQASNGILYGLTSQGGAFTNGVLFSYNPATNTYKDLVDFTNGSAPAAGARPCGSLIQASDGKLYGMTSAGGSTGNNMGVIFSYSPTTAIYTDLYEFTGGSGGSQPQGSLLQASNGLLYGLTSQGGNNGQGDIFSFNPITAAFTELADLGNVDPNLANPYGGLIQASNGLLYGMASSGHIFSSDVSGNVTILVTMDDDGSYPGSTPYGNLLKASNGILYGLTSSGGANEDGVLFSYNISNSTYTDLVDFGNDQTPTGSLIQTTGGLLYGFTTAGGANSNGAVFSYDISSTNYVEQYSFSGNDGSTPYGTPVQASNGLIYGAVSNGGSTGNGTLFSLSLSGSFTNILSFQAGATAGAQPQGSLVLASNGKLFGMTYTGGANGAGTLFSVDTSTGNATSLFDFDGTTGASPFGSLIQAGNGLLYGMTSAGGTNGLGNIFSFDPASPSNPPVNLYSFTNQLPDYGNAPWGDLMQASNGLLYGMTQNGGASGTGNIFSFDPANPGNAPVDLYDFPNGNPAGSLMQASNGLLYGMTRLGGQNVDGNIFSFDPANPGNPAVDLYDFTAGAPDYGEQPYSGFIQASNGLLYGMTEWGGQTTNYGNIISFDPANPSNPPVDLWDFGQATGFPGSNPGGNLVQASDSNLYGLTYGGGTSFSGIVFQYNYHNSVFNDIHDFTPAEAQFVNMGSLIQAGKTANVNNTFLGYTPDWFTATNWSNNAVPDSTSMVIIPTSPVGGNNAQITGGAFVKDIQANDGAIISIDTLSTLSVYGIWTGGITTNAVVTGSGVVQLVSAAAQTLGGKTQFQTLVASNGNTNMATSATIDIYGKLVLQTGIFNASNNNTVTFRATSTSIYGILQVGSGTYSGFITDECYYDRPTTTNSFSQHMMGTPVDVPLLSQFGANGTFGYIVDVTCDETKSDNDSPYGTVFAYDESHGNNCVMEAWESIDGGENALDGVGYSVRLNGGGTVSATGRPNLNDSYTIAGTNSNWSNSSLQGRPYSSGWVLLSNPYPAPLKISPASISQNLGAGWDAQIQVWNTTGTNGGSYQPATILAPFQAFMVHITNPGTASYTMNGSDRFYGNTNPIFYSQAPIAKVTITATNTANGLTDNTTVGFDTNATSGFDPAIDLNKLPGQLNRQTLYTIAGKEWMSTNMLKSIEQSDSVPMGFEPGSTSTFTFSFDGINSFDGSSYLTLFDKKQGTYFNLRDGNYTFSSDSADNWNRFTLLFTPAAQISTTAATCSTAGVLNVTQDGPANWNYTVMDEGNTTVSTGTLNNSTPVNVNLVEGSYTLTLVDTNGYTVTGTVQIDGDPAVTAAFTGVDSAKVDTAVGFTSTSINSSSDSWNFGDGTTATGAQVTHTYDSAGTYTITLTSTSDSGCSAQATHTVIVTAQAPADSTTGLQNITENYIKIWSNENMVNVSFGKIDEATTIIIYNELGQQLVNDKLTTGSLYTKAINNIETGYVIVMVKNGAEITTGKVFISNSR